MAAIDFPASPTNGQVFVAGNGITYVWNGTVWLASTSASMASDTPPSNPQTNQLWFNSALGQLFIYYNDGNTSQWVPANPSVALPIPGAMALYSEQVLTSPTTEMRVTIPVNAKKVEIVYETRNVGLIDAMMRFQAVEGSTPYVGVTYVNGLHFQSQNTPVAYASPVQAGFIEVTGRGFSGTLRPMINTVLNSLSGDGTFSGFTAGAVTTYNGQVSFMYISGIPSMSTITGWRLANTTAVNFQAGSFMRCYVVT